MSKNFIPGRRKVLSSFSRLLALAGLTRATRWLPLLAGWLGAEESKAGVPFAFFKSDYAHLVALTSGASWTVPPDWNSTKNRVECIGGGAGGRGSTMSTPGGGGSGSVADVDYTSGGNGASGVILISYG